jgi:hypothetical protein
MTAPPMTRCGRCAVSHHGAVSAIKRMCEECALKQPNYGLPAEGTKRWCAGQTYSISGYHCAVLCV